MGRLRVFKDQHTVRAPRTEDRRKTTWWGADRPPHWADRDLPAASCRQLSPTLSLRCSVLEKLVLGSFTRYVVAFEGPKRRTREGRSEWEPIKILFKNSAYEPDFTRASPQASLAKSTQPLKCYWT
jgi:hypothetical protein